MTHQKATENQSGGPCGRQPVSNNQHHPATSSIAVAGKDCSMQLNGSYKSKALAFCENVKFPDACRITLPDLIPDAEQLRELAYSSLAGDPVAEPYGTHGRKNIYKRDATGRSKIQTFAAAENYEDPWFDEVAQDSDQSLVLKDVSGQCRRQSVGQVGLELKKIGFRHSGIFTQALTTEHIERKEPDTVQVRGRRAEGPTVHFRRHVHGRAEQEGQFFPDQNRAAEVDDLHEPEAVDHDVGRFHVEV